MNSTMPPAQPPTPHLSFSARILPHHHDLSQPVRLSSPSPVLRPDAVADPAAAHQDCHHCRQPSSSLLLLPPASFCSTHLCRRSQ
ncbi:hypothetical protein M0R45_000196 [Rubus argutus]|uniref:Uncharacterized protein n=1 Tax=Rubus argutus TaxID=59490 RepID=A0AAW1VRG0_RUBAR